MKYRYFIVAFLIIFFAGSILIYGDIGGKSGRTLKTSAAGCGSCHGSSATPDVSVSFSGPDTVNVGQANQYTLTISKPGKTGAGLDIARRLGTLAPVSSNIHLSNSELVHSMNIPMSNSSVTVQFRYTAPTNVSTDTLWATGLATNSSGGTGGDSWNWAPDKKIVVRMPTGIKNFSAPEEFILKQNYPNPFNPSTNIEVDLVRNMDVNISIYDALGNRVSVLQSGKLNQGENIFHWNAANFPSGVYYYEVKGSDPSNSDDSFVITKKMALVR